MKEFIEKARASISKFCIEDCKAYCCRKGYLIINKEQVSLLKAEKNVTVAPKNKFSLHLPCPSLTKDFKCSVHDKDGRPDTCKQFPLFVDHKNKTYKLSYRCLAVRENLLLGATLELRQQGYK